MSNSKGKNFREIISKLRQQVSDNCESIKKLTESSNEILLTVSRLEDSMAAFIEVKISEACSSILARLEALEKFKSVSYPTVYCPSWSSKIPAGLVGSRHTNRLSQLFQNCNKRITFYKPFLTIKYS